MKANVLVVEDSSIDQLYIRKLLQNEFELQFADTLREGCCKMRPEPDAVVLDMRLPDAADDNHALQAIKSLRSRAAIIVLSGHLTDDQINALIKGTASGCVTKEHMAAHLAHEIRAGISNQQAFAQIQAAKKHVSEI